MSWHDTHTQGLLEPAEDTALRNELRALMGLSTEKAPFAAATDASLNNLADTLQREAVRRKRIVPLAVEPIPLVPKQKSHWMLLAAATLPLMLAVGGLGAWGMHQKQRAEEMAVQIQKQRQENQQLMAASETLKQTLQAHKEALARVQQVPVRTVAPGQRRGVELVIPVDSNVSSAPTETTLVKGH